MKKRGQVSFFIIVGLIIAIVALLVFVIKIDIPKIDLVSSEKVPQEAEELHQGISDCIEISAEEAIKVISFTGGYLNIPDNDFNGDGFSDSLKFLGNSRVSYWYYQKDNGLDEYNVPSTSDVEERISNYVSENLLVCLNDFSDYGEYDIQYNNFEVDSEIGSDVVKVSVNFPIKGSRGEVEFAFSDFEIRLDSYLGELMALGKEIVDEELTENYLEAKTLNIMSLNDKVPVSGVDLECSPQIWFESDVKEDLQEIISNNVQFIKVKGSNYVLTEDSHQYFELEVPGDFSDMNVNFAYYTNWPFYMDVAPADNGLMRSYQITEPGGTGVPILKSLFCMNYYNFIYDVKYPVLVTLSKEEDSLNLAMMAVIKNNQEREATIIAEDYDDSSKVCESKLGEGLVNTYDSFGNPLDNVSISYRCITHECYIGNSFEGGLYENFPLCINGQVIGSKEGYVPAMEIKSTNNPFEVDLILEKLKEVEIKPFVKRLELNAQDGPLGEEESLVISFERDDGLYSAMAVYPVQDTIKLASGTYLVSASLVQEVPNGYSLEGSEIESCVEVPKEGLMGYLGVTEEKCFSTETKDIDLDKAVVGMVNYTIDISDSDLNYGSFKFYITDQGFPESVEDFGKVDYEKYPEELVFLNA